MVAAKNVKKTVTIQLAVYFPTRRVEKYSLTVVSCAFLPCQQKKHGNLNSYGLIYNYAE